MRKRKINVVINQYLVLAIVCLLFLMNNASKFDNPMVPLFGAMVCGAIILKEFYWSISLLLSQFH